MAPRKLASVITFRNFLYEVIYEHFIYLKKEKDIY